VLREDGVSSTKPPQLSSTEPLFLLAAETDGCQLSKDDSLKFLTDAAGANNFAADHWLDRDICCDCVDV
jgi:hypothetical protein